MNILLEHLILIGIIFFTILVSIPNIHSGDTNFIKHKFIFFIIVFIFETVIGHIKSKKKVVFKDLVDSSLKYGLVAIIGYSLFIDLIYMGRTQNFMLTVADNRITKIFLISISIVMSVMTGKITSEILS